MNVMVIKIPGFTKNLDLPMGATVGDALNSAGLSIGDGESVKVGGQDASVSTQLRDNDRIVIAKGAKGNC